MISTSSRRFTAFVIGILTLLVLAISLSQLNQQLPVALWRQGIVNPSQDDIRQMLFHYSQLPRLVLSLLIGAGLGLVGVLFQQVLRNPLAEPATLGVASGAQLGITVATLWALPGGAMTSQLAAMFGALLVGGLVFGVAWGRRLSPVTLILAGLVLSLYCGAVNHLLALLNFDQLTNLFLWSSGSLNQQDWRNVAFVLPRLVLGFIAAGLLVRPLTLLGLDDGVARNLGLGLGLARFGTLALAIFLSAQWVNAAGIIGFVGLFAPLLAKILGARRLGQRLWLAPLLGALLLCLTDRLTLWLADVWREVPTGAATALVGAPILLWLLPRLRNGMTASVDDAPAAMRQRRLGLPWLTGGGVALAAVIVVALCLGRDAQGWHWASGDAFSELLPWRWPRLAAALCAGIMLAVAGCLIQRLTGNPMASPEVLGISSGAAFGVVILMLLWPGNALAWRLPAGSLGAAITLMVMMAVAGRGGFSTQRLLPTGIAVGTALTTLVTLLLASGDPRMGAVLTWITGSTYGVDARQVIYTGALAVAALWLTPFCRRWLQILPLGGVTAGALGVPVSLARLEILLLAAMLTAGATLIVGPMSFVGLMAPHLARMLGFNRVMSHLVCAAAIGGGLMTAADWAGRMLLFPYQIPAGLLATFIGAPYFVYLLRKQAR
ncbi:Fe(3+)-hydroxamate ABC transporter permease FhuB [Lonsdalea britannica]|uniref:Fe(3+)-hydroxamate ABC transporter permease FhuB n=1 Tax=Lonsdalea britannica TaxID=1082704 RepID=UPI0026E93339|nr:Fe(3+)-hydroxamate ABC transporter permease FhuB [Lonsdalea britannica]